MKTQNIDYTLLVNEKKAWVIVINPIKEDISSVSKKHKNLVLHTKSNQLFIIKNIFSQEATEKFLLVEYGDLGFVKEKEFYL